MESLPQYSDLVARRLFPWNEVDTETNTQLRSYFKELIARRSEHLAKLARPFL
jgi:light-regulated signal transduction histidine kinase (bacteriophytochrome)